MVRKQALDGWAGTSVQRAAAIRGWYAAVLRRFRVADEKVSFSVFLPLYLLAPAKEKEKAALPRSC
ncbi:MULTISPECIES: hypothetical protein [Bradyrhizobium]|uniref:hypothetical protein n=1 Tax=Bradyrhizobium TaxID=374 RepID=UPI00115FD884|nr:MULTISPECIES: hypothetical protein [Bradyrhizobium]